MASHRRPPLPSPRHDHSPLSPTRTGPGKNDVCTTAEVGKEDTPFVDQVQSRVLLNLLLTPSTSRPKNRALLTHVQSVLGLDPEDESCPPVVHELVEELMEHFALLHENGLAPPAEQQQQEDEDDDDGVAIKSLYQDPSDMVATRSAGCFQSLMEKHRSHFQLEDLDVMVISKAEDIKDAIGRLREDLDNLTLENSEIEAVLSEESVRTREYTLEALRKKLEGLKANFASIDVVDEREVYQDLKAYKKAVLELETVSKQLGEVSCGGKLPCSINEVKAKLEERKEYLDSLQNEISQTLNGDASFL